MSTLDREQVAKIARLARLELTPAELDEMTPQLDAIVEFVRRLDSVDTAGVEPLAHALDVFDAPVRRRAAAVAAGRSGVGEPPARRGPNFAVPAALE